MGSHVTSIIDTGLDGVAVDVECHLSNGLPAIVIVGSANRSIDEAKERLRGAFSSSQLQLPRKRITINLAPADIPKNGSGFDLAMAAAILLTSQGITQTKNERTIFIGEVGLDGKTRAVRGIIGSILAARRLGYQQFFVPTDNVAQAQLVPNIQVVPVSSLWQLCQHLYGLEQIAKATPATHPVNSAQTTETENDISTVVGQPQAKRALEIAAAGGHNLLLFGPPGTGKTMLARCLPGLLPPLTPNEMLAVTQLHSLASSHFDQIVTKRPFRSPHHSASLAALLGTSSPPKPGEISLSHQGVLLLDEFPEFHRDAIEALRQPLENRTISVARGRQSIAFPANFILVATANPCQCGYYDTDTACKCLPHQVMQYQRRLSGPIIDRIDLCVEVLPTNNRELLHKVAHGQTTAQVRSRVINARSRQQSRRTGGLNSELSNRSIQKHANLTTPALRLLNTTGQRMQLSARAYLRTLKVARTVADLEDSLVIDLPHITEALQFRQLPP